MFQCGKRLSLVFAFIIIFNGVGAAHLDLEILKRIVCDEGQQVCVFDGSCYHLGNETCSRVTRRIEPLFMAQDLKENTVESLCCQILSGQRQGREGQYNGCLFLYGNLTWDKESCRGPVVCERGYQFCVHSGQCCNMAEECCSDQSKACKKVFDSEDGREALCSDVLNGNKTDREGLFNVCLVRNGITAWKGHEVDRQRLFDLESDKIILIVMLVLVIGVSAIVIGITLKNKCWKLSKAKKPEIGQRQQGMLLASPNCQNLLLQRQLSDTAKDDPLEEDALHVNVPVPIGPQKKRTSEEIRK